MLKNLALASVFALADAVKLECCPATGCCDGDDGDHEPTPADVEETIEEGIEDAMEVLEGGVEAELEQEAENVIDEVIDEAEEEAEEIEDAAGVDEVEEEIIEEVEEAVQEAIEEVTEPEPVVEEEPVIEEPVPEPEPAVIEESVPEPVVQSLPPVDMPPYAALYKSDDCTGEYYDMPVNPDTGMAEVSYADIRDAGFNDKANSLQIGDYFAATLYQHSGFGGESQMYTGSGDSAGGYTCIKLEGIMANNVSSAQIFSMEPNAHQDWHAFYAAGGPAEQQEEAPAAADNAGPSGLNYATFYKGLDCTGDALEIQINEDGSPKDITYQELGESGWNDQAVAVRVPHGYEVDVWQHYIDNGWKETYYGEEANGAPVCQDMGDRAYENSWLTIRQS